MTHITPFPSGKPHLSPSALSIWAKSIYQDPRDHSYLQLWQHMEDTGSIAAYVWDEFLPKDVKQLIAADLDDRSTDQAVARNLYRFIATIHDVGKASPAFAVQTPEFADRIRQEGGLAINPAIAKDQLRSKYRHELVGYAAIQDWLATRNQQAAQSQQVAPTGRNIQNGLAHGIASIVAGHHGTSLTSGKEELLTLHRVEEFTGDTAWRNTRFELLEWASNATGFDATLHALNNRPLRRRTQILLTGLVIIADWIASDTRLCPLNASATDEETFSPERRARRAWRILRLPKPWTTTNRLDNPDQTFARQFNIPNAKLRPVQREAICMARTMPEPGLMIIEANMGEGKTEAALLSAEVLAARFHCGGVYYALPTQATVNAMFTRVLDWIGHLPTEDRMTMASLFLAHGKRELNDEYETLREQWFDDGTNRDSEFHNGSSNGTVFDEHNSAALQAVVNSWLTGRKRGNLSDFVVGTIDQVLMAGLRCKHVVLRHLALAGKVVILDEIHSNTAYMNVYMETVLSWLGAYGTPVIMLSATLPQARRRAFLEAYQRGANAVKTAESLPQSMAQSEAPAPSAPTLPLGRALRARRAQNQPALQTDRSSFRPATSAAPDNPTPSPDLRYPLISQATADGIRDSAPAASGRSTNIQVALIDDDDESLIQLLRGQLQEGGCAVVIRDTVSRAQRTYDLLSQALDTDVILDHSRFLAFDRARIDRDLIRRFGKRSTPGQRKGVVVATQVVEQSLDVDFDLMVTDIAPIDLILQRAGRLHRHHRGEGESDRPKPLRASQLFITGVTDCNRDQPPMFAKGVESVYPRYLLMRSLSVLGIVPGDTAPTTTHFSIPDSIPRMVQTVYGEDRICPSAWLEGEKGENAAKAKLLDQLANSENAAGQLRIMAPQTKQHPFALDGWLDFDLPDPDTPGISQQRLVSAGVRESDDSFEVIVLQQDRDGNLRLPSWGDFGDSSPLPQGMAEPPSRRQVRDILSCTISLGQSVLHDLNIDAVIDTLEAAVPDQWITYMGQSRDLSGQLLVVLDERGCAQYSIRTTGRNHETTTKTAWFRYSKEKGWVTDVK